MKSAPEHKPSSENEGPHLPGLRTWRAVYWFVIGCFALFVVLLSLLSRAFA